jgi:hypothetical protein
MAGLSNATGSPWIPHEMRACRLSELELAGLYGTQQDNEKLILNIDSCIIFVDDKIETVKSDLRTMVLNCHKEDNEKIPIQVNWPRLLLGTDAVYGCVLEEFEDPITEPILEPPDVNVFGQLQKKAENETSQLKKNTKKGCKLHPIPCPIREEGPNGSQIGSKSSLVEETLGSEIFVSDGSEEGDWEDSVVAVQTIPPLSIKTRRFRWMP